MKIDMDTYLVFESMSFLDILAKIVPSIPFVKRRRKKTCEIDEG